MKFVDEFFTWILNTQIFLEKVEDWYISKRKYIFRVYILTFVMTVILILCKQVILGESIFIFGMVFVGFDNIIGWKHSVRRWLKICVIYNLFFSLILTGIMQKIVNNTIVDMMFIIIYLLVWVFLSLISNSKVALLVNEIVSGLAATIFTIGTYLVSMALKNMPNSEDYLLYFHTDEAFKLALINQDVLAWKFAGIMWLEILEITFMSLLPVIGVTALCIIMIKIKGYWMEKNKISEPEKEIGYGEECDDDVEERADGERERDRSLINRWLQKGRNIAEIADDLGKSEEYVENLMKN